MGDFYQTTRCCVPDDRIFTAIPVGTSNPTYLTCHCSEKCFWITRHFRARNTGTSCLLPLSDGNMHSFQNYHIQHEVAQTIQCLLIHHSQKLNTDHVFTSGLWVVCGSGCSCILEGMECDTLQLRPYDSFSSRECTAPQVRHSCFSSRNPCMGPVAVAWVAGPLSACIL